MKTVLITGAAGGIGTELRKYLQPHYTLRLLDRRPVANLAANETSILAELEDIEALQKAATGADVVVHLGGVPKEEYWDTILPANIIGMYNIFEAAKRAGVKRMVFASSSHAVGFYPREQKIDEKVPVRPDGRYGLSKVLGEALGRLYYDKYGMQSFCIRIGAMTPQPVDVRRLAIWISARDLAQLVRIGIDHRDIGFEIVYGISENKRSWLDNTNAVRLGYKPADRSEDYAAEIVAKEPKWDPGDRSQMFQGGPYATEEFIDDPTKPKGN